jgi:hypothetical protein
MNNYANINCGDVSGYAFDGISLNLSNNKLRIRAS